MEKTLKTQVDVVEGARNRYICYGVMVNVEGVVFCETFMWEKDAEKIAGLLGKIIENQDADAEIFCGAYEKGGGVIYVKYCSLEDSSIIRRVEKLESGKSSQAAENLFCDFLDYMRQVRDGNAPAKVE